MADPGRAGLLASTGDEEKPHIGAVFLGHVDSGKSTLLGRLLFECGGVDQRTMEKLTREAEALGKSSFRYAFVSDKTREERERGVTIHGNVHRLETPTYTLSLHDAPGHRDFLKNAATGASQADVAVLVVAASPGEFEVSIVKGNHRQGQVTGGAREAVMMASAMGVEQLIVVVNKLDSLEADGEGKARERFEEISGEVKALLNRTAYRGKAVPIIAASAFQGHNVVTARDAWSSWYTGPTLLGALDALEEPARLFGAPLRMPLTDVFKIPGVGTVLCGRIAAGTICKDQLVQLQPGGAIARVQSIEMHHEELEEALTGDSIGINVNLESGEAKRGMILCSDTEPTAPAKTFQASVSFFSIPNEVRTGWTPIIDVGSAHVACKITELKETWKPPSTERTENPPFVRANHMAVVVFQPTRPLVVEEYKEFPSLGRFAIREGNNLVGVGRIDSVDRDDIEGAGRTASVAVKSAGKSE